MSTPSPESSIGGEQLIKEIERKFLIQTLPVGIELDALQGTKINQGYLAVEAEAAVRVRQKGSSYFLTYKSAPAAHAAERVELEVELLEDQFAALWPGTEGRRVEKTRYKIPHGDYIIELDVFEGTNAGHMLAEVEFPSTAEADALIAPDWLGVGVTADRRYGNSSIADNGFPAE